MLFVSPPGMLYWGSAFQQFVYMLSEVCLARNIDFFVCATNLRVGQDGGSRIPGSDIPFAADTGKNGNAQLTWDDANHDHGMRLGRFTFAEEGNRLLPDATQRERENMR